MQFIRLPMSIDIAERASPELVSNWINTKSMQNIDHSCVQNLRLNLPISWAIEWSKSGMPHQRTVRDFTHQAWAIWDLSNYDLFWIIPNLSSQKRITLFLESISTVPFQAGTSYVKIPEWGQHSSNCGMPCFISSFGTMWWTGDPLNEDPAAEFRCSVDIFSNITNCEIWWSGMLMAQKLAQVSFDGCTND